MIGCDENQVLKLFHKVHGEIDSSYDVNVECDSFSETVWVVVSKEEGECWRTSVVELMFDFMSQQGMFD